MQKVWIRKTASPSNEKELVQINAHSFKGINFDVKNFEVIEKDYAFKS